MSGARSRRTGLRFDGGCTPSRICGIVGSVAHGEYPGNPNPSPVPDVWLIRLRGVTGCSFVNGPSGTFHDFRIVLTSWSSENRPFCTAFSETIAATGLLIDAA